MKFSRIQITLISIFLVVLLVFLISAIIVSTPLKTLLPGYLKTNERNTNIVNTLRLDSLENEFEKKNAYYSNIKDILNENIEIDSLSQTSKKIADNNIPLDSLITSSEREKDFIKFFDENEKFNLTVLAPLAAEGLVFTSPLEGLAQILSESSKFKNGLILQGQNNSAVVAVHDGTIIDKYYTIDNEFNVTIQHPNGFISKYSNIVNPLISIGDKVKTGQRLGVSSKENNYRIKFYLWHDGVVVNPEEYISF